MKLVSYNIQHGLGRDGRHDLVRIAEALRGADLIALQEVERHWPRPGGEHDDQPAALSLLLPDYHWVYQPAFDMDASQRRADGSILNRRRQHGVMLLARGPILASRPITLPKQVYDDAFNMRMGALEGVVEIGDRALRIYVVHLGYRPEAERLCQLDQLIPLIAGAPGEGGAWSGPAAPMAASWALGAAPPLPEAAVLLGDFNATPDSRVIARLIDELGLVDAWAAAGHDPTSGVTCRANPARPETRDKRIDYCLLPAAWAPAVRAAWIDQQAEGSDHQPVWVELDL